MEGDQCYKYSTVARYVAAKGLLPILKAVDIGACIGDTLMQFVEFFPGVRIDAYEGIENYAMRAKVLIDKLEAECKVVKGRIHVYNEAVTNESGRHVAYLCPGRPRCSVVIREGLKPSNPAVSGAYFAALAQKVTTVGLETIVNRLDGVDFLKIDCEGCEKDILGGCSSEALRGIRFIGGEYHGLKEFWEATRDTLWKTHRVQIMGNLLIGAFFAARLGPDADILMDDLQRYPGIPQIVFHPFRLDYVREGDEAWHGLPPRSKYDEWTKKMLIKTLTVETK